MTRTVLAYSAPEHHAQILEACSGARVMQSGDVGPEYASVLVGVGSRCAELAEDIERFGEQARDAMRGIVLIAPVAPWAELQTPVPGYACCDLPTRGHRAGCDRGRLSLGPLEPLRAWAERARTGVSLFPPRETCNDGPDSDGAPWPPDSERRFPLRVIITAHPEPVECPGCDGTTLCPGKPHFAMLTCPGCSGTGRALGPAEVAREFLDPRGTTGEFDYEKGYIEQTSGGVTVLSFVRADHDREAIGAAMRRAIG